MKMNGQSKDTPYPQSIAKFLQLECILDETAHEATNHRVLELVVRLFKHLLKTQSRSYKDIALLLDAVGENIELFNAVALDHYFSVKLVKCMELAPDCLIPAI